MCACLCLCVSGYVCCNNAGNSPLRMSAVVIMQSRHDQCSSNNNRRQTNRNRSRNRNQTQTRTRTRTRTRHWHRNRRCSRRRAAGSSQRTHFSGHVANVVGHNELKVWRTGVEGGVAGSRGGAGVGCLGSCVQDMQCLSSPSRRCVVDFGQKVDSSSSRNCSRKWSVGRGRERANTAVTGSGQREGVIINFVHCMQMSGPRSCEECGPRRCLATRH